MAFTRYIWRRTFRQNNPPNYPCSNCHTGHFLPKQNTLVIEEPSYSLRQPRDEDWHPDKSIKRFRLSFECTNENCKEISNMIGEMIEMEYSDPEYHTYFSSELFPRGMYPAPPMITPRAELSARLGEALNHVFEIYWCNLSSAANMLRVCTEMLLDDLAVPRSIKMETEKTRPLNLNARIAEYGKKEEIHAKILHALRVVGNLGTHGERISHDSVLDSIELFDYLLEEIISKRTQRIMTKTKKLMALQKDTQP
jgi:hypothetical protein